ncbi:LysR family transcriptional regulator [Pelosinus baikalensis]|uniref:LysR family transcriptional regulator n=1 Tax=Pelosinus baikalensis TaxID=2892015 RepID=A0ABS8HZD1_9FIRM|nr:LysR family transcriptional regulator [Pelosinus baikalensis]MCC5468526.1 LysR family transcriptional regulator [Pelosinus baikalensis]
MELRQLQIFSTAAKTLNFTKTAVELGYVQSNITSQIQQLENELNVKLFERFGRKLQLTSEGKAFLKNAEKILQLSERAKGEFSPEIFGGILNIGVAETLCVSRLPQLLLRYRKLYPRVEIRVQTENCTQHIELIRNNTIDIALTLTKEINQPDMEVRALCGEPMAVVVSPLHQLAQKKIVEPKDLSGECLISSPEGCGYRPIVLSILKEHEVTPSAIMEFSSVGARKECTICGLGVAILPKISVKDELERGRLVELDWKGPSFGVKTQLIYHREKWLSPTIKAFLELCKSLEDQPVKNGCNRL